MLAAGDEQRIDHARRGAISGRPARSSSALRKPMSNAGIVDDQRRVAEESDQVVGRFGKERLVLEELLDQAVNREGLRRHVALGIEISDGMSGPSGCR